MKSVKGIITALATPFKEGKIDQEALQKLLVSQVEQGVDGFVINGTTGESPCLFEEEVEQIFEKVYEKAEQKPVILGVGGNDTRKTQNNIKRAAKWPVSAVLAVVPYYNKPPQRGLIKHFKILAEESPFPVILYNVPVRTGVGLSLESVLELSGHPNIIGIKEASGSLELGKKIVEQTDNNFVLLSGDDETCFDLCALGAKGVISVVSHILGREMKLIFQQMEQSEGEIRETLLKEYREKYNNLLKNVYCESNPIGIKMALKLMNVFRSAELRSPLVSLREKETGLLKREMQKIGLIRM